MTKQVKHCYIIAQGIKARCRKVDRHHIALGNYDLPIDQETILNHARVLLSAMKQVNSAQVYIKDATLENTHGMEIITMMLTGDDTMQVIKLA